MEAEFWLERWRQGRINFHQDKVMPLLSRHWPALGVPPGGRVLVPLCGKSVDMAWLAGQGLRVLGVELSPLAADQFFEEHGLRPQVRESAMGRHYAAGGVEILCGDIFDVDAATLASCDAVYDRAALVALPTAMRPRYADHVYRQLRPGCRGLLITLDYPQDQMDGPPFSVPDAEVQALFAGHTDAVVLERLDILHEEGKFLQRGVERLDTVVYQLLRH